MKIGWLQFAGLGGGGGLHAGVFAKIGWLQFAGLGGGLVKVREFNIFVTAFKLSRFPKVSTGAAYSIV